jgi:DNA replication protein DnaC
MPGVRGPPARAAKRARTGRVSRISERYDYRRSTAITTNRPFKEWPKVFPDPLNAQVIAERLSERCEHFVLTKGFRIQKG